MEFKIGDKVEILESSFTKKNNLIGLKGTIIELPGYQNGYYRIIVPRFEDVGVLFSIEEFKKLNILYHYGV